MSNAIDYDGHKAVIDQPNSLLNLKALQQAVIKLADLKGTPSAFSTRGLIGLFICQAQRNRRLTQPKVRIHLRLNSKNDQSPVYLRLGASNHSSD